MLYFGERAQRLSDPEYGCGQTLPMDSCPTYCDSEEKEALRPAVHQYQPTSLLLFIPTQHIKGQCLVLVAQVCPLQKNV